MSPQEKAKAGLWLLKQALLEYLAARPEGVRPTTICDDLDLHSADAKGGHKDYLLWGLEQMLTQEGKMRMQTIDNLVYFFPVSSSEG